MATATCSSVAGGRSGCQEENLDDAEVHRLGMRVGDALERARAVGIVRRSPAAEKLWESIYNDVDDEVDGMLGALSARAEAQMLRLSVAYALTDGSSIVEPVHLAAARAVWRYSEATVTEVFGIARGNEIADKLLGALERAGDGGLDGTDQRAAFSRHVTREQLDTARASLEGKGLVHTVSEPTGGRPRLRSYCIAQNGLEALKGPSNGV